MPYNQERLHEALADLPAGRVRDNEYKNDNSQCCRPDNRASRRSMTYQSAVEKTPARRREISRIE
jgi:hypothetical protein